MKIPNLFMLTVLSCLAQTSYSANIDGALIGEPVQLHDGGSVRLADLVGEKPMYVKFWASWCVPCREQMPHLERTYREYSDYIEILSVNIWINETDEAVVATRHEFDLTVPIAIDERGNLARAFDFFGTPYHVLIDGDGDIVHTGHEADSELDRKIGLLAARETDQLPALTLKTRGAAIVDTGDEGLTVFFFTATWCDWYLKESRPSMSNACIEAQQTMNRVHEIVTDIKLLGLATPLWTTEKELQEYLVRFDVDHNFAIDESNDVFFALNVKTVPTLVLMRNGKEVSRISDFTTAEEIVEAIQRADDMRHIE